MGTNYVGTSYRGRKKTGTNSRGRVVLDPILCGTCDLPAKSKFLNFNQFNSLFGCSRCLAEGGRVSVNKTTVQVYPYRVNVPDRNHEETIEFGQQALRARITDRKASVNGIKGPTLLSKMVPDISNAQHILLGIFLGVQKNGRVYLPIKEPPLCGVLIVIKRFKLVNPY